MSASTQTGETTNGNGHASTRKPRSAASIAKQKATAAKTAASKAAAAKAPLQAGQQPAGTIATQTNVAVRRIGAPGNPTVTAAGSATISIAWLREREQYLETEVRVASGRLTEIRSMIASFGPRKAMTTAAPKKARSKKLKRRTSPAKLAA